MAALNACQPAACDDVPYTPQPQGPEIRNLTLLRQNHPDDPWSLVFALDFSDPQGAVGGGDVHMYVGGKNTTFPLLDYFEQSEVAFDATAGTVAIPLHFSDSVRDASTVPLGMQLVNALALRSNCYALDLKFTVRKAVP